MKPSAEARPEKSLAADCVKIQDCLHPLIVLHVPAGVLGMSSEKQCMTLLAAARVLVDDLTGAKDKCPLAATCRLPLSGRIRAWFDLLVKRLATQTDAGDWTAPTSTSLELLRLSDLINSLAAWQGTCMGSSSTSRFLFAVTKRIVLHARALGIS